MTAFDENLVIDGTPVIRVENDFLQVDVAPGVGGRIVNLLEKSSNYQFLWHNAALKLEKIVMFIILTLIIMVASFNIISTLSMMVMEKNKDIGILKSMGATKKSIRNIFMLQGVIIGGIGTIAGLLLSFILCFILAKYQFIELPPDVYYISTLPVKVEWLDVSVVAVSAVLISLFASWYPAVRASRLYPAEALKYE